MALSDGLTLSVIHSLEDRPLEAKRLTTILEAQDERVPRETPRHPIRNLQGALEESLVENADLRRARWPSMPSEMVDSATRRRMLLQQLELDGVYTTRWRQRPEERHHPLTKLIAQISFALHLLHKGFVSSDAEVIRILQTYVGEIDSFLEQTTEDFDLAIGDIEERIKCLRLPLEHDEIFDSMLEDRVFRKQIVDGNEKIEHIINRTEAAMNDALDDVQQGLDATKELAKYLVRLDRKWAHRTDEQEDVYAAMSGNSEGWFRCFFTLQSKGHNLSILMVQLSAVVAELQRRAGIASRKNIVGGALMPSVHPGLTMQQAALIANNRTAVEHASARNGSTRTVKALPEGPSPVVSPAPAEEAGRRSPAAPGKPLPSLESLSPPVGIVAPRRLTIPARDVRDERSASAQGMLEGRRTSSRTSLRSAKGHRRSGSLREPLRHSAVCTCSCKAQGNQAVASRRSSITRALLFGRKRSTVEPPSPPRTAESYATAPAFPRRPLSPPGPDSAYSSGESIGRSITPEPDRICSPAPTFTSDLYHSALPSSSRLHDGKAAAIMGTLQRSGSQRGRDRDQEKERERERDRLRERERDRALARPGSETAVNASRPMTASAAFPPLFSPSQRSTTPHPRSLPRAKSRATSVLSRTKQRFSIKLSFGFFKNLRRK